MSGWSCPNEQEGTCTHVPGKACDPGMKGCVLFGKFRFANSEKNSPKQERLRKTKGLKETQS